MPTHPDDPNCQRVPTIVRLSDAHLTLAAADQDIRGRKVIDSDGREMGVVDELMIDDLEKKVRFLRVEAGGFIGFGGKRFLIPVDAIRTIDSDQVHIDRSCEHLQDAPPYNPELISEEEILCLYGYYGYAPFWAPGYIYPLPLFP
jgi:sporulation protein YlmC with PRC-barrel domain